MQFHVYETGTFFVNREFYEVRNPACSDSFSLAQDKW